MKSLKINSDNCLLSKNSASNIYINNKPIGELIGENLPEGIEEYRNYPTKINIQIEFLGEDKLNIATTGYEVQKEDVKEDEVKENEN